MTQDQNDLITDSLIEVIEKMAHAIGTMNGAVAGLARMVDELAEKHLAAGSQRDGVKQRAAKFVQAASLVLEACQALTNELAEAYDPAKGEKP